MITPEPVMFDASEFYRARQMAMITVELEPHELHVLIVTLRDILSDGPRLGVETSKLKMLLQRIEYLEGLE